MRNPLGTDEPRSTWTDLDRLFHALQGQLTFGASHLLARSQGSSSVDHELMTRSAWWLAVISSTPYGFTQVQGVARMSGRQQ